MTQLATTQKTNSNEKAKSLVIKMAERFGVDSEKFMTTLKSTAFKQRDGSEPTNEQMMALMVVADQYGLNPFTREIYAFPDKYNGIVPVVGVDGWSRIVNQHPQFDGVEFRFSENLIQMPQALNKAPEWIEAVMYRKDRSHPIVVREYLDECYKTGSRPGPWQTHPKRFLRHKTYIQGARIAFGFVGIYDQDEAENIIGNTIDNATGQVVSMTPSRPEYEMTEEKYESFIQALIARGTAEGCWPSIYQLLDERFANNPARLQDAKRRISNAEFEALNAADMQSDGRRPAAGSSKGKAAKAKPSKEEAQPESQQVSPENPSESNADVQGSLDMG
jgi:phage recombination protein Bet